MKISLTGANGHQIGRMQGIWRHFLILKNFLDYWQLRFNYCLKVLKRGEAKYCFCESFFIKKNHVMKLLAKHGQKQVVFFVLKFVANQKFDWHLLHSKSDQLRNSLEKCFSVAFCELSRFTNRLQSGPSGQPAIIYIACDSMTYFNKAFIQFSRFQANS